MEIIAYTMQYAGTQTGGSSLNCIPMEKSFFDEYMRVYNECFHEMRKALDVRPYDFLSSYGQIENKVGSIFLLIENGEIAGSVACYGNEIDDLIVNPKYRRKGYGRGLLLWAIDRIREKNSDPITLHAAKWNENAVRLYKSAGFEIIKEERVR